MGVVVECEEGSLSKRFLKRLQTARVNKCGTVQRGKEADLSNAQCMVGDVYGTESVHICWQHLHGSFETRGPGVDVRLSLLRLILYHL